MSRAHSPAATSSVRSARTLFLCFCLLVMSTGIAAADVVTDWNARAGKAALAACIAPGDDPLHGADDLEVDGESDHSMLAFLHLSEKAAASRFTVYRDVLRDDPPTYAVFDEILHARSSKAKNYQWHSSFFSEASMSVVIELSAHVRLRIN